MAENNLGNYYENYAGLTVDEYVEKYIYANQEEMDRISSTVRIIPDNVETVLDVGAGHSVFLEILERNRGIRGVGVEITDAKVEYGLKNGFDIRKGSAQQLCFPDNSFDLVISSEVIEHLPYGVYEASLKELERVAKKFILISVPYNEDRVFTKCPYCASIFSASYHMRVFDDHKIQHLFDRATLMSLENIGETHEILWLFKGLKKFKKNDLPIFFNCPVCGFHNNAVEHRITIKMGGNSGLYEKFKSLLKKFVCRKKPKWYLALYRIND